MPAIFTKPYRNKEQSGYAPDGAGILYPYAADPEWNSVFRAEVRLRQAVDPNALRRAVQAMEQKYPYFFTHLAVQGRHYVFAPGCLGARIFPDTALCAPFDLQSWCAPVRILYTTYSLAVEFFHGITDGHGGALFVQALLQEYAHSALGTGSYDAPGPTVLPIDPRLRNTEDAYAILAKSGGHPVSRQISTAYQLPKTPKQPLRALCLDCPESLLVQTAHRYGVTVSVYLAAVQLAAILDTQPVRNRVVRLSVPVDLRRYFSVQSCRNASSYFLVAVRPAEITGFDRLVQTVKQQFQRELDKEKLRNTVYTNVKTAQMPAFRMLPLGLKKLAVQIGMAHFGENQFTATLTNLGRLELAGNARTLVADGCFILGEEKTKPFNLAVTTYGDCTHLVASGTCDPAPLLQAIAARLLADRVPGRITDVTKHHLYAPVMHPAG